jgi:hypothetical protein
LKHERDGKIIETWTRWNNNWSITTGTILKYEQHGTILQYERHKTILKHERHGTILQYERHGTILYYWNINDLEQY